GKSLDELERIIERRLKGHDEASYASRWAELVEKVVLREKQIRELRGKFGGGQKLARVAAHLPCQLPTTLPFDQDSEKAAQSAGSKPTEGAGKRHNKTEKTPRQAPSLTKRRATVVSKLIKELRTIKPKMHNQGVYGEVKRGHPKYLIFRIAEKDSE